jgi:hypothetical protein
MQRMILITRLFIEHFPSGGFVTTSMPNDTHPKVDVFEQDEILRISDFRDLRWVRRYIDHSPLRPIPEVARHMKEAGNTIRHTDSSGCSVGNRGNSLETGSHMQFRERSSLQENIISCMCVIFSITTPDLYGSPRLDSPIQEIRVPTRNHRVATRANAAVRQPCFTLGRGTSWGWSGETGTG